MGERVPGDGIGRQLCFDQGSGLPLSETKLVVATVGHDAHEPCLEGGASILAKCLVGAQKGILGGVSRCVGVAQDAVGDAMSQVLIVDYELVESVEVALPGSSNERLLIHVMSLTCLVLQGLWENSYVICQIVPFSPDGRFPGANHVSDTRCEGDNRKHGRCCDCNLCFSPQW